MLVAGAQAAVLGTDPALRSGSPWAAMLCGGGSGVGGCVPLGLSGLQILLYSLRPHSFTTASISKVALG